ncbi:Gfo/Idh/MocA family oxidoreductase [Brevibacillus sp. HB1.1]|uniref:Gfo/Idh/MocA family protein n=1 Tax=Brevibacillus sp. HB1.1 TaxID=2738808 RepID=UPI0015769E86|nr:Gfo/Idh/MocA family oxidoreductase [Brevibacillus sp. HB1.1]NTU31052.1 Gfo/Idh/MocA family oxidoreductase [Brevibacillus sp. HB1.1]
MKTIGIIGLGPMGQRYVNAVQNMEEIRIAVADVRADAVKKIEDFQLKQEVSIYSNHLDMLQNERVDILIIATNGPSHYPLFLDARKYGVKKVICEKPIAISISQAKDMVNKSEAEGMMLAVNHGRRWSKDYIALRDKIRNEVIGPVESVMFSMGGGQLGCNGTHFIDLVSFLLDQKVVQVCGFLNDENIPNPRGAQFKDPGGYAIFHLSSGTRMFFEMTDDLGIPPLLIINGKYGRIIINELKRLYTIEAREKQDQELSVTRYGTPLKLMEECNLELDIITLSRDLVMSLLRDELPANPLHAVEALEVVIGIHFSHETGNKMIELPLTDKEYSNKMFSFT